MEHIKILQKNHNDLENEGPKSLISRVTGRFYTHEFIGKHLVNSLLSAFIFNKASSINMIDPFCGDGRLITWLIEGVAESKLWESRPINVTLWDYDEIALWNAKNNVQQVAQKYRMQVHINALNVDTFIFAQHSLGQYHIVVTNPPWEILKPDQRELKNLNSTDTLKYIDGLRQLDERLMELYPISRPRLKFSGWGTNLARCGTEVALRITSPNGICGLVSPASLLADQSSEQLRRWIFSNYTVHDLAYYPSEARLFDYVDQPSITLVASPDPADEFSPTLTVYNKERKIRSKKVFHFNSNQLKENGFVIPIQFGSELIELFTKWRNFPTLGDFEKDNLSGFWVGRELDETGYQRFLAGEGDFLFLKGRMIKRFGIVEEPTKFVRRDGPRIPVSANYWRLVWRDVSRPSQKRRLHATLIPPGWVCGNSLNVAYFRNNDLNRLKALLAIFNSLIFEIQVRAYLSTAHISLGSVRKVRIPPMSNKKLINLLSDLTERCLIGAGGDGSLADLEVCVAKLYNLSQDEFKLLLSGFDKLEEEEVSKLLSSTAWHRNLPKL
jgi:Alw26I/Eco31I/Esp3I family type II restriction m6 adenine DNA methyltransferase